MLITPDGNRMLGNRRAPATTEDIESYMHPYLLFEGQQLLKR